MHAGSLSNSIELELLAAVLSIEELQELIQG